jgi:hypothetical protein
MEREITIKQLCDELKKRIDANKTIDCCKDEIVHLADIATEKIGHEKLTVHWVEKD